MKPDKKIKVGQKVFVKNIGHNPKPIREATVTAVKTKYFWVDVEPHVPMVIATLMDQYSGRGYGHSFKIYLSQQELDDEREHFTKSRSIEHLAQKSHLLPLEDVRKIYDLFEEAFKRKEIDG